MENNRQKKIAGIIQEELAKVLQQSIRDAGQQNLLISVTKVNITVDLSVAKVYLSVFPGRMSSMSSGHSQRQRLPRCSKG